MLVSVVVICYNSEKYIIETLDSIYLQTYRNLELIISDDNSGDDTLVHCQNWLKVNAGRFTRTLVLNSDINTGVTANCNRGLQEAQGEWIKFCAADDTLKPGCINDNILWIENKPEIRVLFSRIEIFKDTFQKENHIKTIPVNPDDPKGIFAKDRTPDSQYRMLLVSDRINNTPSVFLHRQTLSDLGGFDERYRMMEDYPLWLKLTKLGQKLYFMDKVTVNYRQHSMAINNRGESFLINPNYFRQEEFRKSNTYKFLPSDVRLYHRFKWSVSQLFRPERLNKNKKVNRFFYFLFTIYLNPFKYYLHLKKIFIKRLKTNEFYS